MQQLGSNSLTQRNNLHISGELGFIKRSTVLKTNFDVVILTSPLVLGFVNVAYGSYAIVGTLLWFGLPRVHRVLRGDTIDLLAFLSILFVLVSPYWHSWDPPTEARSASLGAALTVAFFLAVRWFVGKSKERFLSLVRFLVWIGVGLSVFVLSGGIQVQTQNTLSNRLMVEFANANYAAAALSTTAIISLFLALQSNQNKKIRALYLLVFCFQIVPIIFLGSRAALAGVILGSIVALFFSHVPRFARFTVFFILIISFISGWFPSELMSILVSASEPISQLGPLARSQSAIFNGSGRMLLWEGTAKAIELSPWIGWGPGNYATIFNSGGIPAHTWGLEYVASVGYFGTTFLVLLICLAYWKKATLRKVTTSRSSIWNSATAIALVPNLLLSTHQWTAWAWLVVSLWSCSYLLDQSTVSNNPECENQKFSPHLRVHS